MKKINASAANAIVGGTCKKVCTLEYVSAAGGACNAVTTCYDKHGKVVSTQTASADSSFCPAPRP